MKKMIHSKLYLTVGSVCAFCSEIWVIYELMTVHKMHFCINGKNLLASGFVIGPVRLGWHLANIPMSLLAAGQWTHAYEMCHKGSVSPGLSLVSSCQYSPLIGQQLSWPAAGCFSDFYRCLNLILCLTHVIIIKRHRFEILFKNHFSDMVCLILSTLTSARAPQRPVRRRNCSWCPGVQTGN